jgi:hypothetical protein
MGTANITKWYDVTAVGTLGGGTAGTANVLTIAIASLLVPSGANKRIGHIQQGNMVRFYVYDIA